eukprot:GHUV01029153.1.p1 GENE.GHUV01029153.1~~GHUV01029153.1.p1  ORF type:complete len:116 (+),score=46.53 GHUV01029153.1:430-777(+)
MLDKITYAADLENSLCLTPQQALTLITQQLEQAGGSFKKLTKNLTASPALLPNSSALPAEATQTKPSSSGAVGGSSSGVRRMAGAHSVIEAGAGQLVPQLEVQPLQLSAMEATAM